MGGVGPYTYALECALPRGLSFNPDTRVLSGAPLDTYRGAGLHVPGDRQRHASRERLAERAVRRRSS